MKKEKSDQSIIYTTEDETLFEETSIRKTNSWTLPWSDFTFIMFVVMLAYSISLYKKISPLKIPKELIETKVISKIYENKSKNKSKHTESLYNKTKNLTDRFDDIKLDILKDNSIKISMQGPIYFSTGMAGLLPKTKKFLKGISGILNEVDYNIHVVGHTDDVPMSKLMYDSNWELSVMRAVKVARYLIEKNNIDPERFSVTGRSKYMPLVPNTIDAFKAKNRRVDIVLVKKEFI